MEKKEIKYEFLQITQSGRINIPKGAIEIRFFYNSNGGAGVAKVNLIYSMDSYESFTGGAVIKNPYELILINNSNEVDVTEYNIQIPSGALMTVVYKYFIKID